MDFFLDESNTENKLLDIVWDILDNNKEKWNVYLNSSRVSVSTYIEIEINDDWLEKQNIEDELGTSFKIRISDHDDKYGGNDFNYFVDDAILKDEGIKVVENELKQQIKEKQKQIQAETDKDEINQLKERLNQLKDMNIDSYISELESNYGTSPDWLAEYYGFKIDLDDFRNEIKPEIKNFEKEIDNKIIQYKNDNDLNEVDFTK